LKPSKIKSDQIFNLAILDLVENKYFLHLQYVSDSIESKNGNIQIRIRGKGMSANLSFFLPLIIFDRFPSLTYNEYWNYK